MDSANWHSSKYPSARESGAEAAFDLAQRAVSEQDPALFRFALAQAAERGQAGPAFLHALLLLALPREGGGEPFFKPLIEAGLALDGVPRMEFLPLSLAIRRGNAEAAGAFLAAGANPSGFNTQSDSPLLAALKARRLDLFELCLSFGADPSQQDERGFAPLHSAAADGQIEFIRALLRAGADPAALALESYTPVEAALECGQPEAAALIASFIDQGAIASALPPAPSSARPPRL